MEGYQGYHVTFTYLESLAHTSCLCRGQHSVGFLHCIVISLAHHL